MARTLIGKQITRLNAVRTGHRSLTVPLPSEAVEYESFSSRMRAAFATENPIAEELVHRACSLAWRLRRFRLWSDIRIETRTAEAMAEAFEANNSRMHNESDVREAIQSAAAALESLEDVSARDDAVPATVMGFYWETFPFREEGPDTWGQMSEEDRAFLTTEVTRKKRKNEAFLMALPSIEREAWFSGLVPKRSELEDHERVGRLEQSLHRQLLETLAALREFV